MLTADIDGTGNPVDARTFGKWSAAEREAHRGRLTCTDATCGAPAFFVRGSRAGSLGHFASRKHTATCGLRTTDDTVITEGQLREERAIIADGDIIRVRFDLPTVWAHSRQSTKGPAKPEVGAARSRLGTPTTGTAQASMGLRRLLFHMARGSGLGTPGPVLQLSDGGRGKLVDLVLHADHVADSVPSGRRLYWGRVVSAAVKGPALWLNSGNVNSGQLSIQLDASSLQPLLEREGLKNIAELWGMSFMCEGIARSKSTRGAVVPVADLAMLALAPA